MAPMREKSSTRKKSDLMISCELAAPSLQRAVQREGLQLLLRRGELPRGGAGHRLKLLLRRREFPRGGLMCGQLCSQPCSQLCSQLCIF